MRTTRSIATLTLLMVLTGCALFMSKESRYLASAQDRATQEDVRQKLGEPVSVSSTDGGEAVWLYEVRDIEPMSQNSWATLGSWCDEYRLTFDSNGVLRNWTHKSYVHGGELMPISCNSAIGVQKPAL
jgi:hypothetical protein